MFADRLDAGRQLAERLAGLGLKDPVVLALPRGGVPVAAPVAERLGAPLDLLMVRKIGAPGQPELAVGAVVGGASPQAVFNEDILRGMRLNRSDFDAEVTRQLGVCEDRRAAYLGETPHEPVAGRDVVIVDDGIATGATAHVALRGLRDAGAASLTLAVPVAPQGSAAEFEGLVDRFICLETPAFFRAVGLHYRDFGQTEDAEVTALLREARERRDER